MKTLGNCDKCGKPVKDGDARYTLFEPERYRHADCHDWRPAKEIFAELREKLNKAKVALRNARSSI